MPKVRRLDIPFHFEDGGVRAEFDIEDFFGKLNGFRALQEWLHLEHLGERPLECSRFAQHHVVPMDHLGPPPIAQHRLDLA
jgi:hypothetical protein